MGVTGSSPVVSTTNTIVNIRKHLKLSDFYKQKGFSKIYIYEAKDGRKSVTLYKKDKERLSMSYSKYVYTSFYCEDIDSKYYQIDHIDSDKTNDAIENLQKISAEYNREKDRKRATLVPVICPICNKTFLYPERVLRYRPNPCCSRNCGGKKSRLSVKNV